MAREIVNVAYQEGMDAAQDPDTLFEDCPYARESEDHVMWIRGYIDMDQKMETSMVPDQLEEKEILVDEF